MVKLSLQNDGLKTKIGSITNWLLRYFNVIYKEEERG